MNRAKVDEFWETLLSTGLPKALFGPVQAQDAVFRFYLPIVREYAEEFSREHRVGADRAQQAAELGLAEAVLSWHNPDRVQFERTARAAVNARLTAAHRVATNPFRRPAPTAATRPPR